MALFPPGRGGGEKVEYGYKGKGVTFHVYVDGDGYPLSIITTSAKGSEREQVIPLLESSKVPRPGGGRPRSCPDELQADKGYDSQELREKLRKKGVRPIIPRRAWKNRRQKPGRKPPKLKDRFKVERCIAWLTRKFRRLSTRWERKSVFWDGFVTLGLILIWLDRVFSTQVLFG